METPPPPPLPSPLTSMHPIPSTADSADLSPSAEVGGGAADRAGGTTPTKAPPNATVPSTRKQGHRRSKKKTAPGATGAPSFAEKKLVHLVIDSGSIIKGAGMTLASAAENFWTIPEVVSEIRDKKARHHLESLPFELKLREPSDEAMKFVVGFARQTGDLRALSRVDLRVLALTYMLERQETGAKHLRTGPVRKGVKPASKCKAVVATPSSTAQEGAEESASLPLPSDPQQAPAAVDASLSGKPNEAKAAVDASLILNSNEENSAAAVVEDERNVDSLCSAVKKAWTDDVIAGEGAGSLTGSSRAEGGVSAGQGDGKAATVTSSSTGYVEDEEGGEEEDEEEEEESGGEEEEEEEEDEDGEDGEEDQEEDKGSDDCDDEWEPEGNIADGENTSPTPAKANGKAAAFTADDFPTLGGSPSPPPPTPAAATDAAALAPGSPSPIAPASASSWSLMARSNPAPFKIPAKRDPAPLPAAAPPATTTSGDTRGHFSTIGGGAAGARAEDRPRPDGAKMGTSRILSTAAAFGVSGGGAEEDDGEGWVNPSNIKSQKAAGIGLNGPSQLLRKGGRGGAAGAGAVAGKCRAGCVTTDFAMQNVIIQVGLPLLSLDGMAVRRVKQWILRCAACFKTCTEMGKLFCPVCGNASLDRVSCSVNAKTGATQLHLRKNHKVNLRGSKFSIPAPNPAKGRFEGDLLLREDQLLSGIWAQKARRKEKDVSSMFGEDITGNVGLTVSRSADIVVGYGRKNPNSARGRERRGKKGVKKRL